LPGIHSGVPRMAHGFPRRGLRRVGRPICARRGRRNNGDEVLLSVPAVP
jgi:hypothetical protein